MRGGEREARGVGSVESGAGSRGGRVPPHGPAGAVLGIETSGSVGSVAAAIGGVVVAERSIDERPGHAWALMPAIGEVLSRAETGMDEISGVVIGAGPGSFTGLRVGGAAAKALASTLDISLYATSSLLAGALAGQAFVPGSGRELRYVLFDARRGRVYGALYNVGPAGPDQVKGPHGGTIIDVINSRPPEGTVFMGDGATAHANLLGAAGYTVRPPPAGVPAAAVLFSCCDWVPVDPASWEPEYVREWKPG